MPGPSSNSRFLRSMRYEKKTFAAVFFLGSAILGFFLAYAAFHENTDLASLRSVHVVFRHGAKTPSQTYPNDPNSGKTFPEGPGALTNEGKRQLYQLGLTLRTLYAVFVGDAYSPSSLSVLSSYAPRCQMSAQVLLAALFPPKGNQIWKSDLLWQPIPVNAIPRNIDNMIASKAACQTFTIEKNKTDAQLNLNLTDREKTLFQYLSEKSGLDLKTIDQVEQLFYTLTTQKENGLVIPDWAVESLPEMKKVAEKNLASFTQTDILKRLQAGPMLADWLSHLTGKSDVKLYLYSAHDLTLVNLLRTLGFDDPIIPSYGASLILESHQNLETIADETYIKLLYLNSSSSTEPYTLTLPGCSQLCHSNQFAEIIKKYIPQNWTEECKNI